MFVSGNASQWKTGESDLINYKARRYHVISPTHYATLARNSGVFRILLSAIASMRNGSIQLSSSSAAQSSSATKFHLYVELDLHIHNSLGTTLIPSNLLWYTLFCFELLTWHNSSFTSLFCLNFPPEIACHDACLLQ